jgi:hypothetical protein
MTQMQNGVDNCGEKFLGATKDVYALCDAKRTDDATRLVNELRTAAASPEDQLWLGFCQSRLGLFEDAQTSLGRAWSDLPPETLLSYRAGGELANVKYCLGTFDEAVRLETTLQSGPWFECFLDGWVGGSLEFRTLLYGFREKWLMDRSVAGKRILVLHAGGLGDFVHYSRYVEHLRAEGAAYIDVAKVPAPLLELARNSRLNTRPVQFHPDTLELSPENLRYYDYFTFGHPLFVRYQRSPEDFPQNPGYLVRRGEAKQPPSLPGAATARKVGIIWKSSSNARHEPFRSMELGPLTKLLEISSIQFYSLQFGELTSIEKSLLAHYRVIDMSTHIQTLDDVAGIMSQLDLVISIDSAPAHLAGALGVPVWLMLAKAADWRWGASHEQTTPWYGSMQLFRQASLGDWTPVIERMLPQLRALR